MQASNPGADPLRDVLTRYGTGEQQQAAVPPPPLDQPPPPAAGAPTQLQPRGSVQQQTSAATALRLCTGSHGLSALFRLRVADVMW